MQTTDRPGLTPYLRIGGDTTIRRLVDRFYELMDELPEAHATRKIHPADLTESSNKLFDYLSGWLGVRSVIWRNTATPCCGDVTCLTPSARTNATNG